VAGDARMVVIRTAIDIDGTDDAEDDDWMTNSSWQLYCTCVLGMLVGTQLKHVANICVGNIDMTYCFMHVC